MSQVDDRAPRRLLLCAVVAVAALSVGAGGSRATTTALPTLYVTYDTSCNFKITTDSGAAAGSAVPYGSYQVFVNTVFPFAAGGEASCTNVEFQLTGPGVSISTDLTQGDASSEYESATFQPNSTYRAVDNNHPSTGIAVFSTSNTPASGVTAPSGPSSGASTGGTKTGGGTSALGTTTKSVPFRGTLIGLVNTAGVLSLDEHGKPVKSLHAGRYTFAVTDKSRKSAFTVQEVRAGATTVTARTFVGKRSVTINLRAGQWFFYPTFIGKKSYFIVLA
ncbi:MAG TPA: hypothetical protein VH063_06170 [Gaiellaceae bacterium]|jgi:hypothetical protein|nr:hypothetical protein [Gaiellaceae bacterium]